MDFSLTDEQRALKEAAARFCEREYDFGVRRRLIASKEGFSRAAWATFANLGWLGAGLAEAAGGYGGGPIETAILFEQVGRSLMLEPLGSTLAALTALAAAAPDRAVDIAAPYVAADRLIAFAHNEADMRGDDRRIETVATATGDGWRLSGRKSFILGGPSADDLLVTARAAQGFGLFLLPATALKLERRVYHAVDGRRVCDLILNDVEVGRDGLICAGPDAATAIELAVDHAIIGLCAEGVGAMDAALWVTRDYLKTRRQFGVTISTFQALQHRIADMLVRTELARSMLYAGLAALNDTDAYARRLGVSAAKAQIGEAGVAVTADAIQLHGAIGVTEDYVVGHYYKRLILIRGLYGHTDVHLARVAGLSERS